MAGCWVCTNRLVHTTDDVPVGCCIRCHVHACNHDGDRTQKSEFWCVVCLQWAAVDQSGLVGGTSTAHLAPADPGTPRVDLGPDGGLAVLAPRLHASLRDELDEAERMWAAAQRERANEVVAEAASSVSPELLQVATALAIRAVGDVRALLEVTRDRERAAALTMVHPALAAHLATAGPMPA